MPKWMEALAEMFDIEIILMEFFGKIAGATVADQTFQDAFANLIQAKIMSGSASLLQDATTNIFDKMQKSGLSPSSDMAAAKQMMEQLAAGGVQMPKGKKKGKGKAAEVAEAGPKGKAAGGPKGRLGKAMAKGESVDG